MHWEAISTRRWALVLGAFALALSVPVASRAQDESATADRPVLRVQPLNADFEFDGRLHDSLWKSASDSIAPLVTIEPDEGGEPTAPTIVKVFADRNEIVVAVWCRDDAPNEIVSYSKAKDSVLDEEDHLVIVFDTFLDGRSGYVFSVNPSGARVDGLVSQDEELNSDWDTVWDAKTHRDETGWTAEFRIPIKSLAFKRGLTQWGFNVQRRVPRLQETSRWAGVNLNYQIFQTSQSGLLAGVPDFDFGLGVSIRPAAVGRVRTPERDCTDADGDLVLDMTQRFGPNLQAALTVNTDFAETEVDVRQINLTRFPAFFPEKRSFFLEGADIFEFGLGLDEESMLPFFSRRIGLLGLDEEEQVQVPINAGGKINGRIGNTNLGALVVNTRKSNRLEIAEGQRIDVPQSTMGAMRVSQNLMEESSVGVLATFGDQLGRSGSWSAGADLTLQTSSFRGERNLAFGVWGLLDDRSDLSGDKSAWAARVEYPNDLLDWNITSMHIGDGFDPSLGFVPRNNVHIWDFGLEINPRPSWFWMRRMFHELSFTLFNARNNSRWESYSGTVKPFDWLLESGDRFEAGITPEGDRPPDNFEISDDIDVPGGPQPGGGPPPSYEWTRYFAAAHTAQKRRVSADLLWEFGDYYNGDLNTLEGRMSWKPSAFFTLEFTGERNTGTVQALPDDFEELEDIVLVRKHFTEELFGVRTLFNFSPDLQLSSLTQYDTRSREFGTNNKLRWSFDALGDIFIVYNHNLIRRNHDWLLVSNELPVKIQYTLRY